MMVTSDSKEKREERRENRKMPTDFESIGIFYRLYFCFIN